MTALLSSMHDFLYFILLFGSCWAARNPLCCASASSICTCLWPCLRSIGSPRLPLHVCQPLGALFQCNRCWPCLVSCTSLQNFGIWKIVYQGFPHNTVSAFPCANSTYSCAKEWWNEGKEKLVFSCGNVLSVTVAYAYIACLAYMCSGGACRCVQCRGSTWIHWLLSLPTTNTQSVTLTCFPAKFRQSSNNRYILLLPHILPTS